jgi:hypothetical protein
MPWNVEYTDEFGAWWAALGENAEEDIAAIVTQLEARGQQLSFPYSSAIKRSRHERLREMRVQSGGDPLRVLYAFAPRRDPSHWGQQGRRPPLL